MPDHVILNQVHLQYYLAQYKASLSRLRNGPDHEIYKWKAVKRFQDNWDINASDFPAMLKASLSLTGNLLASVNNFPRSMMEQFADFVPDDVRSMFQTLFDESLDLSRRVMAFEKESERIRQLKPDWNQHYQTPNAISTYLWLRYPEKYYIYKYNIIKDNARKLYGMDMPSGKVDRMLFGFSLYGAIAEALSRDQELVSMSRESLDADCDPDVANHTMTIDFGYFVSRNELPDPIPPETGDVSTPGKARSAQTKSLHGIDHNTILYGPPGTGKTYGSALYAVAIMENKPVSAIRSEDYSAVLERYRTYMQQGLIAFTTFHQSYGYEEFIEGIRPVVTQEEKAADGSEISYEIRDGVFKAFCGKAGLPVTTGSDVDLGIGKNPTVWKVSLEATGDNPTRTECMEDGHIRIGWDEYGETISEDTDYRLYGGRNVLKAFYDGMQLGDLVLSCYSGWTIDAIGVITGDPEWRDEYTRYKRVRKVKWLVKGINENIIDINGGKTLTLASVYRLSISVSDALQIVRKFNSGLFSQTKEMTNRVFIIDEINRGNISKIFGELITLIEPNKRIGAPEALRSILPYSGQSFGVPENVFLIGTMNTADRSIAMMDVALRRRFTFTEVQPDSSLLQDVMVEGLDIAEMLDTMNRRITVLLDREHVIGHSFFLPLLKEPSLDSLAAIFETRIMPLLQEYFYDDYEKISLVLGDNQKDNDSARFIVKQKDMSKLFGNAEFEYPDSYVVNREAFRRSEAYACLC